MKTVQTWKQFSVILHLQLFLLMTLMIWSSSCQKVCPSGYEVWQTICVDVDECNEGGLGQCSQLCTNTRGSYHCACYDGYRLDSDGWTCQAEGHPFYLIFSQGSEIIGLQPDGIGHRSLLTDLGNAVAMDYHFDFESLFWLDDVDNILYKALLNGSGKKDILKLGNVKAVGLAVDWINNNIYWTDAQNNKIERSSLDGSNRQEIAHMSVLQPRSIVVDPLEGRLYWSCWGSSPRILYSRLDGTEPEILVFSSILQPNGLTLDFIDERLFWVDNGTRTLESINFDGSNRKIVLFMEDGQPYSLSMFLHHVYWTDSRKKTISRANKYTGADVVGISTSSSTSQPLDVNIVHAKRQPNSKPISPGDCNSTGCLTPSTPVQEYRPFAVFANRNDIRRINFDGTNYRLVLSDNMRNVLAMDYDPIGQALYFADADLNKIEKVSIDGTSRRLILAHDINGIEGIAVDWIHRKLYWTELDNARICRSELDGTRKQVIISTNITKPRGIVIYPHLNVFYWTDWGDNASKIEVSSLDGKKRAVVASVNVTWPNGITIDYQENKVLWCDAKHQTIEVINLDGTGRYTLVDSDIGQPFAITQFKDDVWFTDLAQNVLVRIDETSGDSRVRLRGSMDRPSGLQIIHPSVKKPNTAELDPCSVLNGLCDQLCYQEEELLNKAVCACRHGYRLQEDRRSCQLDECSSGIADCDDNALCIDTVTGYQCHCQTGYHGDGFNCTEIIEEEEEITEAPDHHDNCPLGYDKYCLNGGVCVYYEMIDELACKCAQGYTGTRCQYKSFLSDRSKSGLPLKEKLYISIGVSVPVVAVISTVIALFYCRSKKKKQAEQNCANTVATLSLPPNVYYENKGQAERFIVNYSSPGVGRTHTKRPRQLGRIPIHNPNQRLQKSHPAVLNNSDIMSPKRSVPLEHNGKSNGHAESYVGFNRRQSDIPEAIKKPGEAIPTSPIYAQPTTGITPSVSIPDNDYMDMSQGVPQGPAMYVNLDMKT
ncbi:pro-epidermal growth factor-like [Glandiceps talaboti]